MLQPQKPKVTIGLPTYNAERYITQAITSIICQSFQDWELLIVDDGSSDHSLAIARSFGDPRITVIAGECNRGLPFRLNQIVRKSAGEYVARMDADDLMHPERIEKQFNYLQDHPDVDVVGSSVISIDSEGLPYGIRHSRVPTTQIGVFQYSPFIHPSIMARSMWLRDNPYNEANLRAEDYELWVHALNRSYFAVMSEPLLFYRDLGLPYLAKYVKTAEGVRQVIKSYGPGRIGPWLTRRLLLESHVKQLIFSIASRIGFEDALTRRRSRPLTSEQQQYYLSIITDVLHKTPNTVNHA